MMGALAGAGAIAIAGWLGEAALKREAMGFGDVTLMAVVGAALGPQRGLLTIFIGAALGVVVFLGIVLPVSRIRARSVSSDNSEEAAFPLVPFGVFLAPAAVLALFYGDPLIHWYISRFMAS
jgi:leader peptidase (prepilin peptidase)/N-methyltransferase